jgi:hypothetical protein
MPNAYIKNQAMVVVAGAYAGVSAACCTGCGGGGEDCLPTEGCVLTVTLTDINCCEDDIFEVFLGGQDIGNINMVSSPPGCCDDCSTCPATSHSLSGLVTNANSPGCQTVVTLALTGLNCCNTYMEVSLSGPSGTQVISLHAAGTVNVPLAGLCI